MNRHNCYTVNTDRIYILLIYQYLYAYIHVVSELAHKQSYYFIFSSFFGCGGVEVVLLMIFKSNHYHWHCRRHHPLFTGSYGRKKSSNNNKQKTKSYKISNKNFHKISIKCQYKETHTSVWNKKPKTFCIFIFYRSFHYTGISRAFFIINNYLNNKLKAEREKRVGFCGRWYG